jgi:hypothetical protein
MGDWEFLHEMNDRGYSAQEIADTAGSGAAPWEWDYLETEWLESQLADVPEDDVSEDAEDEPFRSRDGLPYGFIEQAEIFFDLVDCAKRHIDNTGRYLQIWGELGEIYAEMKFGLRRHGSHRSGSDGTISGRLVEVKTISPEKTSDVVRVKRGGNFEQLLIVRINRDFGFQAKLFERSELKGKNGKFLKGELKDDERNA